jgi:hypothetical protein
MTRDDLEHVWAWANEKLATGEESPWMWDQYLKLCEILDAIGTAPTMRPDLPQSAQRRGMHLRLVADNVPRRSESGI